MIYLTNHNIFNKTNCYHFDKSKTSLCMPLGLTILKCFVGSDKVADAISKAASKAIPQAESAANSTQASATTSAQGNNPPPGLAVPPTTEAIKPDQSVENATNTVVNHTSLDPAQLAKIPAIKNTVSVTNPAEIVSDNLKRSENANENNVVSAKDLARELGVPDKMYDFIISEESSLRFKNIPVVPSSILTQDSPAVIQAKYAIQHFVKGLQRFRNDTELFDYWSTKIKEHPGIMTRAFQVAVEITYNKRKFSGNELTKILEGKIDILAVGDSDIAKIDSSTLYSILQTNHILNQHDIENAVVVLPPANTANLTTKVLSPTDQVFVQGSQQATGNTVCDTKFLNHYYDYKAMGNFKFTKNHILFIDFHEQESIKPYQFLKQLLSTLKAKQQMQREDKITIEYYEKATKKLEYVLNNKNSNLEKLDEWNAYVFSTLERRPNTIFFPLMIPTNRDSITKEMLNDSVVNMTFPLKKALETFDIKKILDDIYSRMTPKQLRDATYITRGAYEDSDTLIETN